MSLEAKAIELYLPANVIPSRRKLHVCVDGRIPFASELSGGVSYPGISLGTVEAALAVNKRFQLVHSVETVVDAVNQAYIDAGYDFTLHTDDHTDPAGENIFFSKFETPPSLKDLDPTHPALGCAHGATPLDPQFAGLYALDPEDMLAALNHIKYTLLPSGLVVVQKYKGGHQEVDTIANKGKLRTFNHDNPTLGQHFVKDVEMHRILIEEEIYPRLRLPGLQLRDLLEAENVQTEATLRFLARKQPDRKMRVHSVDADQTPYEVQTDILEAA